MNRIAFDSLNGYVPLALAGVRVLILLAGGFVLTKIIKRLIAGIRAFGIRVMARQHGLLDMEVEKRANTVASVARRTLLSLLWGALIITALQELGFKIDALLAGAGVSAGIIGVAVGFGAQSLIKDVLAGLFMLVENHIRVRDVAIINGTGGVVEEINLRTTVLRSENGAVHIFQNGSIQSIANLTREFSYYVFDLGFGFEQDTDRVVSILRAAADELRSEPLYRDLILDALDVIGVDRFTGEGVYVKARIKTLPMKQWVVGREMNRRIHQRFLAENVQMLSTHPIVQVTHKV